MKTSDLLSVNLLSKEQILHLLNLAREIKSEPRKYEGALAGRVGVLIFEKPSLRTRVTFEVALTSMGANAIYLAPGDIQFGVRETVEDVAHNLERWVDVIVARVFEHEKVEKLAEAACIPVVNALSDDAHPCQALGDYFTLMERFGDPTKVKLAYVGDGNNVCCSLLLVAATLGARIAVCTPSGYETPRALVEEAKRRGKESGAEISILHDPQRAVAGAAAVYTDVWASMGQETTAETRRLHFRGHQVNKELMAKALSEAVFMHCLPAHRGEEVTDDVIDGENSIVFDQAENRLHIQKAILHALINGA